MSRRSIVSHSGASSVPDNCTCDLNILPCNDSHGNQVAHLTTVWLNLLPSLQCPGLSFNLQYVTLIDMMASQQVLYIPLLFSIKWMTCIGVKPWWLVYSWMLLHHWEG